MLNIIQRIIPATSTGRRPGGRMVAQSLTIHSTGNPKSTAKNEAENVLNHDPMKETSFHFVVDDKEAYQLIPITEHAWHAGDGEKGPGNLHSVSIEICESGDRLKTLQNAVELAKKVLIMIGLTPEHIFQHNHWSGKNCPRILRDPAFIKDGLDWNWFMTQLRKKEDDEMITKGELEVDGKVVVVDRILKDGKNFVELRDLCEATGQNVTYDSVHKRPVIKKK